MNKYLFLIVFILTCLVQVAWGGAGTFPQGTNVRVGKPNLIFKSPSDLRIMSGDTDSPAVVAKDAVIGSMYFRSGTSEVYVKTDAGSSTNWETFITGLVDLTSDVTGILPIANGGTNSSTALNNDRSSSIPSGLIAMWSGATAAIPTGWAICDGTNGTPNLAEKFIIGTGGSTATGATGANDLSDIESLTLLETNLPAHTHTISSDGGHTGHPSSAAGATSGTDVEFPDATLTNRGAHDHGGTTGSVGDDTALDVSPPYYALAFIMKL